MSTTLPKWVPSMPPELYRDLYWHAVVDALQLAPGSRFHGSAVQDVTQRDINIAASLLASMVALGEIEVHEHEGTLSQQAFAQFRCGGWRGYKRHRGEWSAEDADGNVTHHWYRLKVAA